MLQMVNNILLILVFPEIIFAFVLRHRTWRDAKPGWHMATSWKAMGILTFGAFFCWGFGAVLEYAEIAGEITKSDAVFWSLIQFMLLLGANLIAFAVIGWAHRGAAYDENGFIYHTVWLQKKQFTYADITEIRGRKTVELWCGETKMTFYTAEPEPGEVEFLRYALTKYRCIFGRDVPPTQRRDVFRGNVDNPNGKLMFGGVLAAIAVIVSTALVIDALRPVSEENAEILKVQIANCYPVQDALILRPAGNDRQILKILKYKEFSEEREQLIAKCGTGTLFTVAVERPLTEHIGKSGVNETYIVVSLRDSSFVRYVTEEQASAAKRSRWKTVLQLDALFLVGLTAMCALAISVKRNPAQYSEKMQKAFSVGPENMKTASVLAENDLRLFPLEETAAEE